MTMNAMLRCAIAAVACVVGAEMLAIGYFVFANHEVAVAEALPVMEVSDVAYEPLDEINAVVAEEAALAAEVEDEASESEEVDVETEEYASVESDWQPEQEVYDSGVSDYAAPVYDGVQVDADAEWASDPDLRTNGTYYDGVYTYTYYSQNVLPGGGLDIPGRHVDEEGYVCDGDGNLCVASDDLPYGTVVEVPFGDGTAVVYDTGSGYGNLDVYTAW